MAADTLSGSLHSAPGEATDTMRKATVNAIMPIGWPPLSETLEKVVAKRIPIFS